MIKKIFYTALAISSMKINAFAANSPDIKCEGLPGCNTDIEKISANIITEMIKYIAVLAVLALMISWIMYMLSGWEEEKTKKAKTWIIWSLVGVFLSISSYYIVSVISKININIT